MKYRRFIITGTAGFIGGYLSRKLKKSGFEVIDVDIAPRSDSNLDHLYPDELFQAITNSPHNFDNFILLHVGADSNANTKSINELQEKNIDLTRKLVNLLNEHGIPVLFISSAAVYGNSRNGEISVEKLSPYAQSKVIGEQIVKRSGEDYGIGNLTFRLFNCYGEGELKKGPMMSVPSRFTYDAMMKKKIEIWDVHQTPKVQSRDFIYVGDLANLISLAITEVKFENQILDAGSGTTMNFIELAEMISKRIDCETLKVPAPKHVNLANYQLETISNMKWLSNCQAKFGFSTIDDNLEKVIYGMS